MESHPESTPAQSAESAAPEGSEEAQPGFWSRMFGGGKAEGEEGQAPPPPPPAPARNKPRKPKARTIFDKAEAEQKQRCNDGCDCSSCL